MGTLAGSRQRHSRRPRRRLKPSSLNLLLEAELLIQRCRSLRTAVRERAKSGVGKAGWSCRDRRVHTCLNGRLACTCVAPCIAGTLPAYELRRRHG